MLPRYARPEIAAIWSEQNKYQLWLQIEILTAKAQADLGLIPHNAAEAIQSRGRFDIIRIQQIERETQHEMLAFLTNIAEEVGPEARFLHQGLTSSDILDTCLALQLTQAADILLADLDSLLTVLKCRALEHQNTLCIGRTHGIHAEPTTFGRKLLGHHAAFERNKKRLILAREEIATCKLSGAIGNYATVSPQVEAYVASKLGLKPEPISTQIIPRDRHAVFFSTLGVIAGSIENLALEIRHLQRSEVREVAESFSPGQKGSSSMPHKRNPILSENLTGLARIIRAAVIPSLENIALWHERDMSHSSVERVFAPDATITLDFALHRLAGLIDHLRVYPERMKANLESQGGLYCSQAVLLALTQAGISREEAYQIVQRHALDTWEHGGSFQERLSADSQITRVLPVQRLSELFGTRAVMNHSS